MCKFDHACADPYCDNQCSRVWPPVPAATAESSVLPAYVTRKQYHIALSRSYILCFYSSKSSNGVCSLGLQKTNSVRMFESNRRTFAAFIVCGSHVVTSDHRPVFMLLILIAMSCGSKAKPADTASSRV